MDTDTITREEELEIQCPTQDSVIEKEQKKNKPITKLLYGGIPADPEDLGLQLFVHDPKKFLNHDEIMIGREIKAGNIKFTYTNNNIINREKKSKDT